MKSSEKSSDTKSCIPNVGYMPKFDQILFRRLLLGDPKRFGEKPYELYEATGL